MTKPSPKPLAAFAASAILCALPLAARANTVVILPDATWNGFIKSPVSFPPPTLATTPITGPGVYSLGTGNSEATATLKSAPLPSLSTSAGGMDAAQFSGGQSHAVLTYFIEIFGPGSGLAPLKISGHGAVTSFNGGVGSVSLTVSTPGIGSQTGVVSNNGHGTIVDGDGLNPVGFDFGDFAINETKLFPLNTVLQVQMIVISDSDFELGPSAATAFLDPMFSLDPSFADAGLYSILLSPGIGNGATGGGAVPEPSTWSLMLLGFAGLGVIGRRRAAAGGRSVPYPAG